MRAVLQARLSRVWLETELKKGTFPREDYKQLAELALIWLGGTLPNGKVFKFMKPGAFHAARFMSKAIYLLKIALLSKRIDLDDEVRRSVHRMATFIGIYYCRYFLRTRIPCFAPLDDWKFLGDMVRFGEEEDQELATVVIESIKRHLW